MKAWLVREKDEFCATVVFADTRGKARAIALHTECCEDADFCSIEVNRQPQMDKYYTDGKREMDWEDSQDRIALVKDCGFSCREDCFDIAYCEICPAKEYCDSYKNSPLAQRLDNKETV